MSDRNIKILGLKNCDKCRDAQTKLNNLGYNLEFIDVRKNPIGLDQIKQLIAMFGNQILNKRSTTFRGCPNLKQIFPQFSCYRNIPL